MNPHIHKADDSDAGELQGQLREAVDKIKAQPLPAESLTRSLERAKSMNVASPYWVRRRSILALAGIAAALLIGLLLLPNVSFQRSKENLAFEGDESLKEKKGKEHVLIIDGTSNTVNSDEEGASGGDDHGLPKGGMGKDARKFTNDGLPELGAIVMPSSSEGQNKVEQDNLYSNSPGQRPKGRNGLGSGGGKGSGAGSGQGAGVSSGEDGKVGIPRNQTFIDPSRGAGFPPGFPGGGAGLGGGLGGGGLPGGMGAMGGAGLNGGVGGLGGNPGGPSNWASRPGFPGQNRSGNGAAQKPNESEAAPRFANPQTQSAGAKDKKPVDDNKSIGLSTGVSTDEAGLKKVKELKELEKSRVREDGFSPAEIPADEKVPLSRADKGKADNKEAGEGKASKKPQVYRRRAGRPSFARVYVGDQTSLELVSLQVTTTIEGPRARTVVDHIFHNPHDRQLEGTFEYPLPAGASPSYFAMFLGQTRETVPLRFNPTGQPESLPRASRFGPEFFGSSPTQLVKSVSAADWGVLQEAHIVNKAKGLETYEEVVRGRIDPALLEYAGGNTFSGRVFPIPPKGYNRVLIAYEELLPASGNQLVYRYPLPDCPLTELEFNLQASPAECKEPSITPKDATLEKSDSRLLYSRTWKGEGPGGDVVFAFTPAQTQVQAISGRQNENSPLYLYARIKPELKVEKDKPFADKAIFLLDTSLSEHPDRFAVNMMLLKKILESDKDLKQFNILTFNVGCAWVEPKGWLENSASGRETALSRLDGLVLEGATDVSAALQQLAKPPAGDDKSPVDVFVLSDGQITWG
ncbi:MAG TPA: VIT and VWA domain-containing protein, partial [Gemmataceae bacterium]|nr:VIT and VWA domain-containing protein [Gemmataceae bacterium]